MSPRSSLPCLPLSLPDPSGWTQYNNITSSKPHPLLNRVIASKEHRKSSSSPALSTAIDAKLCVLLSHAHDDGNDS